MQSESLTVRTESGRRRRCAFGRYQGETQVNEQIEVSAVEVAGSVLCTKSGRW